MSPRAASPPVPVVGLTGAVAAGKSEALSAFGKLGAETLSSDQVVHDLLAAPEVAAKLVERWGEEAAPGGEVDRARVGAIVFERPEELAWLEGVLHPLVGERVAAWRSELGQGAHLAVVEVPLLFETGMEPAFDATVAVVAADEVRAERADGRGTESFAEREARQLPEDEKAARATHVLANDGTLQELETAVAALIPALTETGARA
ncbi:MAG: dephospho-CoA kinase [bacterium]